LKIVGMIRALRGLEAEDAERKLGGTAEALAPHWNAPWLAGPTEDGPAGPQPIGNRLAG
jgi:hypothetical protein